MALCPFAELKLLPESKTQPRIEPRIIIDHTQAGSGSLYGYWLTGTGLEDHFQVMLNGVIEQHMDTEVRADANLEANGWWDDGVYCGAIAIETENSRKATELAYRGGQGAAAFDRDPWTPEQIQSLLRLHAWLADTHPTIRRQRCDQPLGSGLGYHSMWGTGPTPWIPYKSRGKKCPGDARIAQHNQILLPAFTAGTDPLEFTMDTEAAKRFAAIEKEQARQGEMLKRIEATLTKGGEVRDGVVSIKRHAVDGAGAAKGDDTVPERIIDSLARIEKNQAR